MAHEEVNMSLSRKAARKIRSNQDKYARQQKSQAKKAARLARRRRGKSE